MVIFGASGDLTWRKLIPALYNNFIKGRLSTCAHIVGFARRPLSDAEFRDHLRGGVQQFSPGTFTESTWEAFASMLHYFQGHLDEAQDFSHLAHFLETLEGEPANRLYYLATAPEYYAGIAHALGKAGMARQESGWRRIVIEKPFGHDLDSAHSLNQSLHQVFDETQVYRIDHYLGKETAQNILFLRFANAIFEPVWNRRYVDHVQVTVAESVEVGRRAGYYDTSGVLRDMFQNHLLQLLALVAMEAPASFTADAVRNESAKVLQSIRPIDPADSVRAQYAGYCELEGVAKGSQTPTYAALKIYIDNWRWKDVPFYLRSGKALARKASEIAIVFQRPPHLMFNMPVERDFTPNILSICIQPDEGIHLRFEAKQPDSNEQMRSVEMDFHYRDSFGDGLPEAYEKLLLDALEGDAALFTRSDAIETSWKLIDPVLQAWENANTPPLVDYQPGAWGPDAADNLLQRSARTWLLNCGEH
jgi:glucose-6-phosphate 1-dehydrogenase